MATLAPATTTAGRTYFGRAVGSCGECGAGIAIDGITADTTGKCPGCGARVRMRPVYGEHSDIPCNGACMGAVGPACSCACGGENHGRWFLRIDLVPVFDRDKAVAAQTKRQAAHAARREEKRAREARERRERVAAMVAETPELAEIMGDGYAGSDSGFILDMRAALRDGRELSPGQTAACVRTVRADRLRRDRAAERAQSDAAATARGVRVPAGRMTVSGVIVSAKSVTDDRHSYHGRTTIKVLVQVADGWRVYGTLPKSTYPASYSAVTFAAWRESLPGQAITLTAEVQPSDRDPLFGFFSRPAGAQVGAAPAPEPDAAPVAQVEPAPIVSTPATQPALFVSGWAGI